MVDGAIKRTRLVERIESSSARLLNFFAPAGYGKSELIRSLCSGYERQAIVDCAQAKDLSTFNAAVADGLGTLHRTTEDAASLFVFENAHALMNEPRALKRLGELAAEQCPGRTIAIASRVKLPLRLSAYCAPHEVFTVGASDLRFDPEETIRAFGNIDVEPRTMHAALRIANGWPVAVLLFVRFAREGRLETLLNDLSAPAFADLHEYIVHEVLASLPIDQVRVLMAMAAIQQATMHDIAGGLRISVAEVRSSIDDLAALPGFVSASENGSWELSTLLQAAFRSRRSRELGHIVVHAAREAEAAGDDLRAAELHVAHGNVQYAATALSRLGMELLCSPSHRVNGVLHAIPPAVAATHLKLNVAKLLQRTDSERLPSAFEFIEMLSAAEFDDVLGSMNVQVLLNLAELALDFGCFDRARELLARAEPMAARDGGALDSMTAIRALHATFAGQFRDAAELRACIDPARSSSELANRLLLTDIWIAIGTCKWETARDLAVDYLASKRRSNNALAAFRAWRLMILTSWLVGDEATFKNALRAAAAEQFDPGLSAYLQDVASGTIPSSEFDGGPRFATICDFILALAQPTPSEALACAQRGIDRLQDIRYPFLSALGNAIAALIPDADHRGYIAQAQRQLEGLQCDALEAAVAQIAAHGPAGDCGVLTRFARSLRPRAGVTAETAPAMTVDVLSGTVCIGSQPIQLSSRGLELLVALGLFGSTVSKERITDAIWPELDGDAALSALKTCVHRTRIQLGDRDAIVSTRTGYTLQETARVDVWETAELLRSVKDADEITEGVRRRLRESTDAYFASSRAYAENWAWFSRFEEQLARIYYDATLLLARDATVRDALDDLLQLGEYLVTVDSLDEAGYELRMRAFVASGDRVAAHREFRRYLKAVKNEAHASPSTAMCALISDKA